MPNYNYRPNDYMRRSQCQRIVSNPPSRVERDFIVCTDDRENISHTDERTFDCCTHDLLNGLPIAMAYVPWQKFVNLYAAEKALCRGTIFEELDKPFCGKGGCCK